MIQKYVEGVIFTPRSNFRLELYFSASDLFFLSLSHPSHLPYAFSGAEIRENGRKLKENDHL